MLRGGDSEPVPANALLRKPLALMASLNDALETAPIVSVRGRVKEVLGTVVRATAPSARIGEMCVLHTPGETFRLAAPAMIAMLLAEIGLAIVSMFAPQLPVFFLAMPVKACIALFVLMIYLATLMGYLGDHARAMAVFLPDLGKLAR